MGTNIRTFNSAKKFAEEILHPLISSHTNAKLKTKLGAVSDDEARKLSPNQRIMNRFNALKERITFQQALINEIEATVRLNNTPGEVELIETMTEQLSSLETDIEERDGEIIYIQIIHGRKKPVLTKMFKELGTFLDKLYVQIQKLMTKNKLLFYSDDDEYMEDQELKEKIKLDNRSV